MAKRTRKSEGAAHLFQAYPNHLEEFATRYLSGYLFAGLIDTGKTGATYRVKDERTDQIFCLKTIRPDIVDQTQRRAIRESLKKECEILLPISHKCLPRIYFHKQFQDSYYYLCTYHNGTTFQKFRQANHTLGQLESAFVIRSLMDALKCIHEQGRQHCDLHAGNVLISSAVLQYGILIIDFGSGHRYSDTSPETVLRGNIYFKPDEQKPRQNQVVQRHDTTFEAADFRGLGELLIEMQHSFFQGSNALVRDTYLDFARSLFNRHIVRWDDAEKAFSAVIDPLQTWTRNNDLFLSRYGKPQDIPLPVTNNVSVGEPTLAIINTRVFQRLRNIRQLSFCDLFFPGAVHTRFEHSLGVFGNATRAVERLVHNKQFRERVTPIQSRGLLLASLIHDVGHYPFAHPIEQYAASRLWRDKACLSAASHVNHTLELLRENAEFQTVISDLWKSESFEVAASLLSRGGGGSLLKSILDGPIDVDKIDYLRRDAHHCGMPYGAGADVDGLFQSLAVVRNGKEIGVVDHGVPAVEGLLILQDQMLASVYWHPIVRGAICMFHAALAHIVEDNSALFLNLITSLKAVKSESEAIETVIKPSFRKAADRIARQRKGRGAAELQKRLGEIVEFAAESNFKLLYRPIAEHPRTERAAARGFVTTIYAALVNEPTHTGTGDVPIDWPNVKKLRSKYLEVLKERHIEADELDVVIDVPYGKAARSMVYVLVESTGEEEEITKVSNLPESIFTQPAAFTSPVRIYGSPRLLAQTSESSLQEIIQSAEERFFKRDDTINSK